MTLTARQKSNISANSLVSIVLTAGLILSVFAWTTAANTIQREERLAFQGDANDIACSLTEGLFAASQNIDTNE